MQNLFNPRSMGLAISAILTFAQPRTSPKALAQDTFFTYQGRLDLAGAPYTGNAEFRPNLWDAPHDGSKVADNAPPTLVVTVTNGLFTLPLDFGASFPGAARWLQLEVRTVLGPFTLLSPRQPLTPTPYAITAGSLAGALPAAKLGGPVPSANLAGTYSGVLTFDNPANQFTGSGAGLTALNAGQLTSGTVPDARLAASVARTNQVWLLGGNAGTTPGPHFIGTRDNQPLELRVHNQCGLRLEPPGSNSVNVIGGWAGNGVRTGTVGATLGGGGAGNYWGMAYSNRVEADFGTVSGGAANVVGTNAIFGTIAGGFTNFVNYDYATIGGGRGNTVNHGGYGATISGGADNTAEWGGAIGGGARNYAGWQYATTAGGLENKAHVSYATVGGGYRNNGSGYATTVAGGQMNVASGYVATVAGGWENFADGDGAVVAGGVRNTARGRHATIAGGRNNAATNYAFAAGYRAKANHDGAFVWADATDADFASTAPNQFLIRASGGVGIGGAPTDALLDIEGTARLNDFDVWLRGGTDRNHGLGWYGLGKSFAGVNVDGPVLYGWAGGGLGVTASGPRVILTWDGNGNVVLDPHNTNNGALWPGLCFGAGSGEGIASKRTAGGNQYSLSFYTGFTERLTILNNGRVGVGRTPTANALEVEGNASKTVAGSWLANSDARIKQDIATLTNAIETLSRVRLVSFRYTDAYRAAHPGLEDRRYLNVVAQEFAEVFPDHVQPGGEKLPDGSDILQVDTHPLTIYTAAAVQELSRRLDEERAANAALRDRLARLEQLVGQLAR